MLDNLNSNFESSKAQRPDANDDEVEIDLLEIFYALKKKILLVLMVALVGGCIAAAYTQFLMTPIYSSTSSILVLSKETTLTSLADLQLGASLTSDYTVLITSTPVMEQVISDLDLDMTAEQLKGSVSINNPTDTRILEITVNNTDSKMAKKIVDEIANVSSSYIGDKMEVIPPKIIEVGKIATMLNNADETATADADLPICSVAKNGSSARRQNTGLAGMPIVVTPTCKGGNQQHGPPLTLSLRERE